MKKILVTKSSMPPLDEYVSQIAGLWESRWLTNAGKQHQELIENLKEYLKVDNFELFSNGHNALEIGLQALELTGEVITSPFTFISTTQAIIRNGLTPVFCDIDPIRWTLDPSKIEERITEKTSAILAVHVYGIPCDVEAIEKIANKHNIKVIYDAAHAFAVRYKGKTIASYGDYSMFSFHATKVYHTIEGGGGAFSNENLGIKLRHIRDFGLCPGGEEADEIGTNGKLSEFHAAMGVCNLRHISEEIAKRKKCTERYDLRLKNIKDILLFPEVDGLERNYAYYPIVFNENYKLNRDQIAERLLEKGVNARKYFYPLTSRFSCYNNKYSVENTPIAEYVSNHILCLPMYADLCCKDIDMICNVITE